MILEAIATEHETPLEAARARGRREAERFDRELRAAELAERRRELARRSAAPREQDREPAVLARLRREEAELVAFQNAVLGSRPWRLAEALRRVVGRSWNYSGPSAVPGERTEVPRDPVQLERRVRELAEFRAAVLDSRAWRVLQALRRLAGREW